MPGVDRKGSELDSDLSILLEEGPISTLNPHPYSQALSPSLNSRQVHHPPPALVNRSGPILDRSTFYIDEFASLMSGSTQWRVR